MAGEVTSRSKACQRRQPRMGPNISHRSQRNMSTLSKSVEEACEISGLKACFERHADQEAVPFAGRRRSASLLIEESPEAKFGAHWDHEPFCVNVWSPAFRRSEAPDRLKAGLQTVRFMESSTR